MFIKLLSLFVVLAVTFAKPDVVVPATYAAAPVAYGSPYAAYSYDAYASPYAAYSAPVASPYSVPYAYSAYYVR